MNYQETLEFLYSQLPMYQRIGKAAYKADLRTTLALDKHFGHPHRKYHCIHVAGTNGKGSVSHLLASVLHEAGYRTGLYTSPHLLDFRERIRVNGKPIPEERVRDFVGDNFDIINELIPSFFEMTVAMAFDHFAREEVDVAVIETGMGGRLDSTNIVSPLLSIITNISMDHSEFLGSTTEAIAGEKGGIIKEGRPLVLGPMERGPEEVLRAMASEKKAMLRLAREHYIPLFHTLLAEGKASFVFENMGMGKRISLVCGLSAGYQAENLSTALTALALLCSTEPGKAALAITDSQIEAGFSRVAENTGFLGRWQVLGANPRSICDTAHNEAGIRALMEQIRQIPFRNLHMVWGMAGDKQMDRILPLLPKEANYYFARASIPRAMDSSRLKEEAGKLGLSGKAWPSVADAYRAAMELAGPDDLVFTGGSTFVVADLLEELGY